MALNKDVYRELEDILGADNLSEDLAVMEGYAYQPIMTVGKPFYNRPAAVALPADTKEVQAVVKLCNRRGIKFKASSTCYGALNALETEDEILLDLRRMNRILEIDEKNMFIVVEPYVSFAQVQVEAMKRGLNTLVIGAGSQTSFLASHTSVHGTSFQGMSQGYSGRNLLGVEWVLPTGEIVNVGSMGSGAGWFSGDGPGPSLRGILRGVAGACGGLGVFTKCAGHLHPWPGPQNMKVTGASPYYDLEIPVFFEYHICEFTSWEKYADAVYKIGKAGIAYVLDKAGGPSAHGTFATGCNDEYYAKHEAGEYNIPRKTFSIILAGNSQEEHDYQVKVLDRVLIETGGKISPVAEGPTFKNRVFANVLKACYIPRGDFRPAGLFIIDGMVGKESVDHISKGLELDDPLSDKYAKKHVIMDDGTLRNWASAAENSHWSVIESCHFTNLQNEEAAKGATEMCEEGARIALSTPMACNWYSVIPPIMGQPLSQMCYNYGDWMSKIKKALDPNMVSDQMFYISSDHPLGKGMPALTDRS
jgi:glycolate oxidase